MPFHFKKSESPVRALRRVGQKHIAEALRRLRRFRHPAAVHGARREIKKLRALFRLVRGENGRSPCRKAAKGLRRAASQLAPPRDARVMLKAFEQLTNRDAARRFSNIGRALQQNCRRETRRFQDDRSISVAKQALRKTNRRVAGLKIQADGWQAIEPGLRQSYRRGRAAYALACQQPSPENLHAWRKRVKDFWYHLRLLCPEWPATARVRLPELKQLGELLGEDHDLVLLKQFVAEHCAGLAGEAKPLNQLIESCRKKIRAQVLALGGRLYAEPPAAVCARLGRHWSVWRGEPGRH